MRRIFQLIRQLLVLITAVVIPRSRNIWVIGGNKGLRFADNSMYFFLYCLKNDSQKVIWLTRSPRILSEVRERGGKAFLTNSLSGLYYGFRAFWHVYDVAITDTNAFSSKGARKMNLWHGYPLKDLRFLKKNSQVKKSQLKELMSKWLDCCKSPLELDYLVWQNTRFKQHALDSFHVQSSHVVIANAPRNMVFEDSFDQDYYLPKASKSIIETIEKSRLDGKVVIGYFPTWRGHGNDLFLGVSDEAGIQQIAEFCKEHDIIIATKWHTTLYKEYAHGGVSDQAVDINKILRKYDCFQILGFEIDLNSVLAEFDILISDYSGVIFDYVFSNKPLMLFPYDLEQYEKEWGFFFDYSNFVPGEIVKTMEDFYQTMTKYLQDHVSYHKLHESARDKIRNEIFEVAEGSLKIVKYMKAV